MTTDARTDQPSIALVLNYLRSKLPDHEIYEVPTPATFGASVCSIRVDHANGWHVVRIAFEFLRDVPPDQIPARLDDYNLVGTLRQPRRSIITVTRTGLKIEEGT